GPSGRSGGRRAGREHVLEDWDVWRSTSGGRAGAPCTADSPEAGSATDGTSRCDAERGYAKMTHGYRKDMSDAAWDAVYARQMERAELADGWLDALELRPGSRLLDVGAGPGYFSLRAAARVGPTGRVIAVDRSAEALAFLATKQEELAVPQITRVVA